MLNELIEKEKRWEGLSNNYEKTKLFKMRQA